MKKIFSIILILAVLLCGTATFINYAYPVKYKKFVLQNCKTYGVEQSLVFAVIKCESGFNKNALSSVGAVGLMQLMPQTAKFIAQREGVENYSLFNPQDNIRLGVAYLKYLIDKFGQEVAIYCYNAGEGVVKRFLDSGQNLKDFPYLQTQNYYKKVMRAKKQYQRFKNFPFR